MRHDSKERLPRHRIVNRSGWIAPEPISANPGFLPVKISKRLVHVFQTRGKNRDELPHELLEVLRTCRNQVLALKTPVNERYRDVTTATRWNSFRVAAHMQIAFIGAI